MIRKIVLSLLIALPVIALDAGTAGAANRQPATEVCDTTEADVLRLYVAFFNREHDQKGGTYWRDVYRNGASLDKIAYWMSQGAEFSSQYKNTTTNGAFVEKVYSNVLGRKHDNNGRGYWLDQMNLGMEKHLTVRWMAQSNELKTRFDYAINGTCPDVSGPTEAQWAALRMCEATGNYGALNPTGKYMGAYQFDQPTWDGVARTSGRSDLIGVRPNLASPGDQDKMAKQLYSERGRQPWPECGRKHLP